MSEAAAPGRLTLSPTDITARRAPEAPSSVNVRISRYPIEKATV